MFSKILIANRGEVAVRIIRSCKEMGISTVAVYSQADAEALHVALADQSFCIGGNDAADSYLNQDRILSAALVSGAQAIHPGYGFLSENAEFAARCLQNGIAFIGPAVETMHRLSDKDRIKTLMADAGLPVIPGTEVLSSVREAKKAAAEIGYPVMLKARSGGGGRGIRLVTSEAEMEQNYTSAVAEGRAAFGDGRGAGRHRGYEGGGRSHPRRHPGKDGGAPGSLRRGGNHHGERILAVSLVWGTAFQRKIKLWNCGGISYVFDYELLRQRGRLRSVSEGI